MEKFYTLFVATDELLTSKAVSLYSKLHDVSITTDKKFILNFPLDSYIHSYQHDDIFILFDPEMIEICAATIQEYTVNHRIITNVSITLRAKDVGSTTLGFATPVNAKCYPLETYAPEFIRNKPISSSN